MESQDILYQPDMMETTFTVHGHDATFTVHGHDGKPISVTYTRKGATVDSFINYVYKEFEDKPEEKKMVGLDVEFTWLLGPQNQLPQHKKQRAAFIQICARARCLLYHIFCSAGGATMKLRRFLADPLIQKGGFATEGDTRVLKWWKLEVSSHIDMQKLLIIPDKGDDTLCTFKKKSTTKKDSLDKVAAFFVSSWFNDTLGSFKNKSKEEKNSFHKVWGTKIWLAHICTMLH